MIERWTAARKAEVVQRMLSGDLGMLEAADQYDATLEELNEWLELFQKYGVKGLRTTRLLEYRRAPKGGLSGFRRR